MIEYQLERVISWVEDDQLSIKGAAEFLTMHGIKIYYYTTYHEAYESRLDITCCSDLLITDLSIPHGRISNLRDDRLGLTLLKDLRTEGLTIPAIFFTGSLVGLSQAEMERLDVTALSKTTPLQELQKHIWRRLGLPSPG